MPRKVIIYLYNFYRYVCIYFPPKIMPHLRRLNHYHKPIYSNNRNYRSIFSVAKLFYTWPCLYVWLYVRLHINSHSFVFFKLHNLPIISILHDYYSFSKMSLLFDVSVVLIFQRSCEVIKFIHFFVKIALTWPSPNITQILW